MDPAQQKAITAQILQSLGDQATVSNLLTQLVDDYTIVTGELVQSKKSVADSQAEIAKLQKTNLDLFLRIPASGAAAADTHAAGSAEETEKKLSYADLFDPKTGGLKE